VELFFFLLREEHPSISGPSGWDLSRVRMKRKILTTWKGESQHQKLQASISEGSEAVMGEAALELNPSMHLLQNFSSSGEGR